MNMRSLVTLLVFSLWLSCGPTCWGQTESTPIATSRGNAVRLQTPGAVVQSSATVAASTGRTEPIPMKSASDSQPGKISTPRSPWASTLATVSSLMLVVFLFFCAALVLRKSQPKQFQRLPKDVVEVLGRTPIAPRQNLVLIRFGTKLVLVSQQPGETRSIAEIQDTDEAGRLMGLCESNRPESITSSFREVLHQVVQSKPSRAA